MLKDTLVQDADLFLVTPTVLAKNQHIIMHHLSEALVSQRVGKDAGVKLVKALHAGDIQAWLGIAGEDGARRIVGMVFTTVSSDPYLGVRRLVVYGLHLKEQLGKEAMAKCMEALEKHAKKRGCDTMVAQTSVRGVSRMLEQHGWTNGQCVLTKEI